MRWALGNGPAVPTRVSPPILGSVAIKRLGSRYGVRLLNSRDLTSLRILNEGDFPKNSPGRP